MHPVRRTTLKLLASAALLPAAAARGMSRPAAGPSQIDWPAFLARHDLVWDRVPSAWDEGPFLGNGMLGAMLYRDQRTGRMRLDVGRGDVYDHRTPFTRSNFDDARLPIGHFLLRTAGRVGDACALRLSLHDAVLSGTVTTDLGTVAIRLYVHAEDMAIVAEIAPSEGERGAGWEWVGEEAVSPRQTFMLANNPAQALADYRPNPKGTRASDGAAQLWLQPLLAGGGTATAWLDMPGRLIASVAHRRTDDGARAEALNAVQRAAGDRTLLRRHLDWWRAYYPASFVSLPDTRIESFYWIQMYKLASATRKDRAFIDNQGPWLQPTPWPSAWWNLNVQLTYWAPVAANRVHLAGSLVSTVHRHQAALAANVEPEFRHDSASMSRTSSDTLVSPVKPPRLRVAPPPDAPGNIVPEVGNLPWALHNLWLVWRHTMDEALLRDTVFPLLRRTTNYYRHLLVRGADGRLHLPVTYSPEYAAAPDLNYDLALLRWSCAALIEAAARLKIDDPLLPEWQRIEGELVDYPQDGTGLMIGAGRPLTSSHRHYSHLLMAYPLYIMNREQPGADALIRRSVEHWQSMPDQLRGYSSTGASSISSAFGRGDEALRYLRGLFDTFLRPNTLYKETGPVIETPLSGAQSIHDMLLQSWGGAIRPFPAVPGAWADCVFADLSAEGGFLVSGRRAGGRTRWVQVTSRAGEPFAIVTDLANPVATVAGVVRRLRRGAHGRLTARVGRGETILLHARGEAPDLHVRPEPAGAVNSFGLNPRNAVPT